MWCSDCRQDVPGIATAADEGYVVCARCGSRLGGDVESIDSDRATAASCLAVGGAGTDSTSDECAHPSSPYEDDWQLDEELDEARLWVHAATPTAPSSTPTTGAAPSTIHETIRSVANVQARVQHNIPPTPLALASSGPQPRKGRSLISWAFLLLGVMTFVCGAVLSGRSLIVDRSQLWDIGLPLILGGQGCLLLGLLIQLEGLWQSNHEASSMLREMDDQLCAVKHGSSSANSTYDRTARTIDADPTARVDPQSFLDDLKRQLDRLAAQLAKER